MSADHYLTGPCEGISIHRTGRTVTVKDRNGREETHTFEDAERAAAFQWNKRDELYRQYDKEDAA